MAQKSRTRSVVKSISFPKGMWRGVERSAARHGMTRVGIVRWAVALWLEERGAPGKRTAPGGPKAPRRR